MLQSFGQGSDRVTPLQMAMVSSAIANGGTEMNPTLIESVLNPDLCPVGDFSPSEYGKPISADDGVDHDRHDGAGRRRRRGEQCKN